MTRPRRRTVVGALAGGSLASLVGVGGWYVLDGDLPFSTGEPGRKSKGLITETARLVPADRDANDRFGHSVALSDRIALIGEPRNEDPNGSFAGAASVFEHSGGGWNRRPTLTPADGDGYDRFGESVALVGDTALVGARGADDPNGENAGAVYTFGRANDGWSQTGKLVADDGTPADSFGASVDFTGTTTLIGAPSDQAPNGVYAGSAYVFDRSDGSWFQGSKLAASEGDENDAFGASVALTDDGTTAVVGAPDDEDPNGKTAGAAFVFSRTGDGWTQVATLAAPDGDSGDDFGRAVDISGDLAFVGAPRDEDPNGTKAGAVYVFEKGSNGWAHHTKLTQADGESEDFFGHSIALAGDTALVSAKGDTQPNGDGAGAVYVFSPGSDEWTRWAKLAPADGNPHDRFGRSVALVNGTALVSAPNEDSSDGGNANAGAAYLFDL